MVLTLHLSSPFLRVCIKSWGHVTLKRTIATNGRPRDLPPTVLKDVLSGRTNVVKRIESASFAKDASSGSGMDRSDLQPACLREELLCKVSEPHRDCCHKVSIVGSGMAGIGIANALLLKQIVQHVAIVDAFPKKLEGEGMDYNHGSISLKDPRVEFDTDFCVTSNSRVVVLCAGVRQLGNESRLELAKRNADIYKTIIPPLLGFSPNAVFVVVTNPVDILSWVTWKVSALPFYRVIGSGTNIDCSRFRYLIGDRLGIAPSSVNAFIIGEHGETQVPLWSGVSVAGVQFRDIIPNIGLETDEEKWYELAKDVVTLGSTVRCLKGYTSTAIGLCVADIVEAILGNAQRVIAVSTMIQGHFDVCHEMYLSLPCVIGENGITKIVRLRMTEFEKKSFQNSAGYVYNVQKEIKI